MTQRLIGASLIVLGGSLYGLALARTLHARLREVRDLVDALHLLAAEIAHVRAPLPEALERVARASRGTVRVLFSELGAAVARCSEGPIGGVWSAVLAAWSDQSSLEGEEIDVLQRLGGLIGRTGVDDQVRALRHAAERLGTIANRLESSVERDARLRLYLGVAGGVTLAILLV